MKKVKNLGPQTSLPIGARALASEQGSAEKDTQFFAHLPLGFFSVEVHVAKQEKN